MFTPDIVANPRSNNNVTLSELEVSVWECAEVHRWAIFYGFYENNILDNIYSSKLRGVDLLNGATAMDLGISKSLLVTMFGCRIDELLERDLLERENSTFECLVHIISDSESDGLSEGEGTELDGEFV